MKNLIFAVCLLAMVVAAACMADVPDNYVWKTSSLDISANSPPALFYVTDSNGNRTGANPSLALNSDGGQGENDLSGLKEIPLSYLEQVGPGDGRPRKV